MLRPADVHTVVRVNLLEPLLDKGGASGLLEEDLLLERAVEVGVLDVELASCPAKDGDKRKDDADGSKSDGGCPGVRVVLEPANFVSASVN